MSARESAEERVERYQRCVENSLVAHENEIELREAGDAPSGSYFGSTFSSCGPICDGVGLRKIGRQGFVIEFADLERWYLAAKAVREQAGFQEMIEQSRADYAAWAAEPRNAEFLSEMAVLRARAQRQSAEDYYADLKEPRR